MCSETPMKTMSLTCLYSLQIVRALDYLKEKHGVIHRGTVNLKFV